MAAKKTAKTSAKTSAAKAVGSTTGKATGRTSTTKKKPAPRRPRPDSRMELIDATIEIILRDGIDALRIEDVCDRVGVTKGSLYWHFNDRTGLIRESLLEHMRRLGEEQLGALSAAVGGFSTRDEYLVQVAGALVDPFDDDEVESRWQRLELITTSRRDPEMWSIMSDIQRRHQRFLTDLMETAATRGALRADVDPKATAAALVAVGMGSNLLSLLGEDGPSPAAWSGFLFLMIETLFPRS